MGRTKMGGARVRVRVQSAQALWVWVQFDGSVLMMWGSVCVTTWGEREREKEKEGSGNKVSE